MYSVSSMGEITTCILYACMLGKQHYFITTPKTLFFSKFKLKTSYACTCIETNKMVPETCYL